jgi:hypothetical protein
MTEYAETDTQAALRTVVRDLETQQRRNGWLLTCLLAALVVFFRWLNAGPYAGNSIYLALLLVVIGMRVADHQLAQGVSRLAKLLVDGEARRTG